MNCVPDVPILTDNSHLSEYVSSNIGSVHVRRSRHLITLSLVVDVRYLVIVFLSDAFVHLGSQNLAYGKS